MLLNISEEHSVGYITFFYYLKLLTAGKGITCLGHVPLTNYKQFSVWIRPWQEAADPLSQPGPESKGVHFVEKGWIAYIQAKNSGMPCAVLIQK